jgi:hypothetical protein
MTDILDELVKQKYGTILDEPTEGSGDPAQSPAVGGNMAEMQALLDAKQAENDRSLLRLIPVVGLVTSLQDQKNVRDAQIALERKNIELSAQHNAIAATARATVILNDSTLTDEQKQNALTLIKAGFSPDDVSKINKNSSEMAAALNASQQGKLTQIKTGEEILQTQAATAKTKVDMQKTRVETAKLGQEMKFGNDLHKINVQRQLQDLRSAQYSANIKQNEALTSGLATEYAIKKGDITDGQKQVSAAALKTYESRASNIASTQGFIDNLDTLEAYLKNAGSTTRISDQARTLASKVGLVLGSDATYGQLKAMYQAEIVKNAKQGAAGATAGGITGNLNETEVKMLLDSVGNTTAGVAAKKAGLQYSLDVNKGYNEIVTKAIAEGYSPRMAANMADKQALDIRIKALTNVIRSLPEGSYVLKGMYMDHLQRVHDEIKARGKQ